MRPSFDRAGFEARPVRSASNPAIWLLAAPQRLRRTGHARYRGPRVVDAVGLDPDAGRRLRHAAAGDDRLPGLGGGGVLEAEAAAAHLFLVDAVGAGGLGVVVELADPLP